MKRYMGGPDRAGMIGQVFRLKRPISNEQSRRGFKKGTLLHVVGRAAGYADLWVCETVEGQRARFWTNYLEPIHPLEALAWCAL